MAGLSSNVMNMKFMQRAQTKKNEKKNEDAIRKVKDSSEWVLPNKPLYKRKRNLPSKFQTVGYGCIATLMTKNEEIKEDDKNNDDASNGADKGMDEDFSINIRCLSSRIPMIKS
ncbi:predicted protein [Clavispora lusitaniae ATCC 42720]|uniref:Uncharacterized protein n=1 Tax=Clavispora lusitaniae (strain ATCC 42720) TaxID=306902 RepID=C4Y671_CLAL4|nr:uncharacterized protein CLUG_03655 [Clavispora lusitaniae ATCC 42720]EEQ39527.1 predicted protein [Clavispora lusitaniae ATCC 42720]